MKTKYLVLGPMKIFSLKLKGYQSWLLFHDLSSLGFFWTTFLKNGNKKLEKVEDNLKQHFGLILSG